MLVRVAGRDAWQIPAFGRRGAPNPSTSIECPATQENPADSTDRGDPLQLTFCQGTMDGGSAKFTEVARHLELLSNPENQVFRSLGSRLGGTSSASRCIGPVNAVQSLSARPTHPLLNCRQSDVKFSRHESQ